MNLQGHLCLLVLLVAPNLANIHAQSTDQGALIVQNKTAYKRDVKANPSKRMVELNSLIPSLVVDLKYATPTNFTGKRMYPSRTKVCYLRQQAALALVAVSDSLSKRGFQLKVFDAYRPYSVTVRFWNLIKDERYVANPSKGSGHNRGIAIDLTLIEKSTGAEVDMGTGFDDFTLAAHHDYPMLKTSALENRKILRGVMEYFGFKSLETEWWHYSLPNPQHYGVLDLSFKELAGTGVKF